MENLHFTRNYSDHSTDRGFQFEFHCDRCGSGYRSAFQTWSTGTVSSILNTASNIFGGWFGSASNVGNELKTAQWQQARDAGFKVAIEEISPAFFQCPKCLSWVCRTTCLNVEKGLCKSCAPDLGVEMAAAQSTKTVQDIWEKAVVAEEDKTQTKDYSKTLRATCPNCEKPLDKGLKFCPECGHDLRTTTNCKKCSTELKPGVKFCPECGEKTV